MGSCRKDGRKAAVELTPVTPVFCSGVEAIEIIDGLAHASFYVNQPAAGDIVPIINVRLILPPGALTSANRITREALEAAVKTDKLLNGDIVHH